MINNSIFTHAFTCMSEAVLIAEPLYLEDSKAIVDFKIVYSNQACSKITQSSFYSSSCFSSALTNLSSNVDWINIGKTVFATNETTENTFYSAFTNLWLKAVFVKTPDDLLLLSLIDVSRVMKHEEELRRQNLKLAALSEELTLSKQILKNELIKSETLNKELEHLAYFDKLTNIPNRAKMLTDIERFIKEASEQNQQIGFVLIDVDNLKKVNDSAGHIAGDNLLKSVANTLDSLPFNTTNVYRFGGDEFLLVAKNINSKNDMELIGKTIIETLNYKNINVSAGISVYPDDSAKSEDLFKFADMAMYDVKKEGKNAYRFFKEVMKRKFFERLNLETKLTNALDTKCLQLFFQPQVDIKTKTLRGFEALLRWHDPDLGWISPEQFIPLAEESKLIIPLGDWILDCACAHLENWQKLYGFTGIMSINVSPIQLKKPYFFEELKAILREHDLDPSSVEIEITEGVFIDDMESTVNLLQRIKDYGIGISLDDFGTGFASLSYLQILPLTTLKIDKSFIANITSKQSREADITDAIVTLVTKMGLDTIAEGVENNAQLEVLESINCRNTQGFLMGKPMPVELCERMLSGDESAVLRASKDSLLYKI